MSDLGRLIILILLLPVFLVLSGPALVAAVFRGRQPLGPILFDTTRYRPVSKAIIFLLGLLLWGGIWGGLAWLAVNAVAPATLAPSPADTPSAVTILITNTPTAVLPAATATPSPSPSPLPVVATGTPALTLTSPTPTHSPTPLAVLTNTPTATALPPSTTPAPAVIPRSSPEISPAATLTYQERRRVEDAVKEANRLLQKAITEANDDTLSSLETAWQGLALNVAQSFAAKIYRQYAKPVQVQFSYVHQPVVQPQSTSTEAVVASREKWVYGRTADAEEEIFDFTYTLVRDGEKWVITRYSYRNVSGAELAP